MVGNPSTGVVPSAASEGGTNLLQFPTIPAPATIVGQMGGGMPPPQRGYISAPSTTDQDIDFSQIFMQQESVDMTPFPAASTAFGGVPVPSLPPNSTTAAQVQMAAAAAAAAALPTQVSTTGNSGPSGIRNPAMAPPTTKLEVPKNAGKNCKRKGSNTDMTVEERKRINRDRNRQHARSTRLRKKAYIEKLKQLVDGLHAERSEQDRKRRVAVQHLAEVHRVRRTVIKNFLKYHSGYEVDARKWMTILEDDFHLKQPVTPYRSFRRVEIELSQERECRRSKGIEAMIGDAASMAVMVESVGSRSTRWAHIKREEFLSLEEAKTGTIRQMPPTMVGQSGRLQALSSLSSSCGNGSSSEEDRRQRKGNTSEAGTKQSMTRSIGAKKVSASSSTGSSSNNSAEAPNNVYHDYHAKPLPDPKLFDSGASSGDSDSLSHSRNQSAAAGKNVCTDSSSDEERSINIQTKKVPSNSHPRSSTEENTSLSTPSSTTITNTPSVSAPSQAAEEQSSSSDLNVQVITRNTDSSGNGSSSIVLQPTTKRPRLPPNIARSGGISHNIRPLAERNDNSRLSAAPLIPLPPFVGIGKRATTATTNRTTNIGGAQPTICSNGSVKAPGTTVSSIPQQDSSSSSSKETGGSSGDKKRISSSSQNVTSLIGSYNDNCSEDSSLLQIQAYYHVNEDDMLLTDDVLMCPFIFRTQDAVLCGALAECVMPGMCRAQFSDRNKLISLEMVFDAMGFMQQLERGNGNEGTAQTIPNSLEMAIQPTNEARVITMAKSPFRIVTVNETWTQTTKYTQMEVEGEELSILHGKRTNPDTFKRPGKPLYDMNEVAKGRPACTVNVYYDKKGTDFIAYVCSFPLTNCEDKVTHILHTFKELPKPATVKFLDVW